jgi:elongation factor G
MLFNAGTTSRIGDTAQGNTVSDYDEEEIRRGLSLATSQIPIEIDGVKLNVLDTPGYTDFQGEVKDAIFVSDLVCILIEATSGIEVGTELYWGFAEEYNIPRMVVISNYDREMARQPQVLTDELHSIFGSRFVPLQLPIGSGQNFSGVIDLLSMKARLGKDGTIQDIPAEHQAAADTARTALMEAAAEADDSLLEKYFETLNLSEDEIWQGVRAGLAGGTFVPVVFTAGIGNIGVKVFTDLLSKVAPDPTHHEFSAEGPSGATTLKADEAGPLALYVFKTTADPFVGRLTYFRVISGTLKGDSRHINHTRGEEERFGPLLVMRGNEQIQVESLQAGDLGAVAKLQHTVTGDSLGDKSPAIKVVAPTFPTPVYIVAVSPVAQADSAKMGPTLTRLCDEDPTLKWHSEPATHEVVIEGMGDVHG